MNKLVRPDGGKREGLIEKYTNAKQTAQDSIVDNIKLLKDVLREEAQAPTVKTGSTYIIIGGAVWFLDQPKNHNPPSRLQGRALPVLQKHDTRDTRALWDPHHLSS